MRRLLALLLAGGCGSADPEPAAPSGVADGGVSLGQPPDDVDGGPPPGEKPRVDGGFVAPDGGVIREDRFVVEVASFTPGACAGFGASSMPEIVEGPPVGSGDLSGSFDVVSLGLGGEIVVSFGANAIVDGPGVDFVVFENAFFASGDPAKPAADPGEVAVSEDGATWHVFPCDAPPQSCAGYRPVYSAPGNGISPLDTERAGGDAFDLGVLGVAKARFVRIRDRSSATCDGAGPKPTNLGFDLDAIAIINAAVP
jgi:hypothetical protein